tara:strand:+ start:3276 stop:4229 length:954 start_codon:yes stop_codon:yes gene_type:complete
MILNQKKVFDLFRTLLFSFRLGRSLLHSVTSIFFLLFLTSLDLYSKDFANLTPAPIKDIKIAAFNTKTFGSKKIKNEKVFDYFVRLIKRYDVIFLQEIRNKNLSAVHKLYAALNKRPKEYDYRITRPLGRSSYKEQYAYFYKKRVFEEVNISETVIYPDEYDDFEREPFLIYLKLRKRNIDFFLVGVHVKPSDVVREVRRIKDVYHFGESYFNDSDAIILGDLNADCSYISDEDLDNAFFNRSDFFDNLIDRDEDTTTRSSTHCAYDKIITTQTLSSFVREKKAEVFNIRKEWNLTEAKALQISDHFPVQVELKLTK